MHKPTWLAFTTLRIQTMPKYTDHFSTRVLALHWSQVSFKVTSEYNEEGPSPSVSTQCLLKSERARNGRKQEQRRELFPWPQSLLGDEERWNRTYYLEKDLQVPKRESYIIQKKISQTHQRVSSPLDHSLFEESHRGGTYIVL